MNGPEFVLGLVFFGGGFMVLRPVAAAVARRIAGEVPVRQAPARDEALLEELLQVRREVADLAERLDFAERLLAKQREVPRIGGGA